MTKVKLKIFKLFNLLFKYCYPLYRPLYFFYKHKSDRDKIALIKNFVKPGMTALDIGANIGFYTVLLSKLVGPRGRVYAFEPERENFDRLEKNVAGLDNVTAVRAAAGERSGKIKLYPSPDLNVDHRTFAGSNDKPGYEVECLAIDDYLEPDKKVDFIKLDVQGYDHYALRGMTKTIGRSGKLLFIGEYWPWGLEKAGTSSDLYLRELGALGIAVSFFGGEKPRKEKNDENAYFDFYGFKK